MYKDALEREFSAAGIAYGREVRFDIDYKGRILPHPIYAEFTVFHKIILEVKCTPGLPDVLYAQTLNYLKVSGNRLGLLVTFGQPSLEFRRVVL